MSFGSVFKARLVNGRDGNSRMIFEIDGDHTGMSVSEYISYLKDKFKANVNGSFIEPTHIRIRNGKVPSFWHVNIPLELSADLFTYGFLYNQSSDLDTLVENKTPLIVEFVNRQTDSEQNMVNTLTSLNLCFVDTNNN